MAPAYSTVLYSEYPLHFVSSQSGQEFCGLVELQWGLLSILPACPGFQDCGTALTGSGLVAGCKPGCGAVLGVERVTTAVHTFMGSFPRNEAGRDPRRREEN